MYLEPSREKANINRSLEQPQKGNFPKKISNGTLKQKTTCSVKVHSSHDAHEQTPNTCKSGRQS
jgi:hypothetical protein